MTKKWDASEQGLPWTPKKMSNAVKNLRNGGSIGFASGYEKLSRLTELDEKVFSVRGDLILHIWSVEKNNKFTEEQLQVLSNLKNIRKLKLSGFKNSNLQQIENLDKLEQIIIVSNKSLDISFLEKMPNLKHLSLIGKYNDLKILSDCKNLEKLYLQQTTIDNLNFLLPLKKLSHIMIDYSRVNCEFKPLEQSNIYDLTITSITNLRDVSFLKKMKNLKKVRIDASKVEFLPDFLELEKLEYLELNYMKVWKNPEVLKTIKSLKVLKLKEINTKLKAEQFYFLSTMDTLVEIDYKFIDFNKGRIKKLNDFFEKEGKSTLIKK
ncbi:hypothetical protein MHTCC0001_12630 [Flavobacteriaceae bacterium MHTCC 0001]